MKVINFFKYKRILEKTGFNLEEIHTKTGVDIDVLKRIGFNKPLPKKTVEMVADALGSTLEELTASDTTFEEVVSLLVKYRWDENSAIDQEHIFHTGLKYLKLTSAECILLYEGVLTGRADCTVQPANELEYHQQKKRKIPQHIIRSEVLEWMLSTEVSSVFIKAGSLTIIGAEIKRTLDTLNDFAYDHHSLNLENTIVGFDLIFTKCRFYRGINLYNSQTHALIFDRCMVGTRKIQFKEETYSFHFNAESSVINGDLKFVSAVNSKHLVSSEAKLQKEFDLYGSIKLNNAHINGSFLASTIAVNGHIAARHLKCDYIELLEPWLTGDIILEHAQIDAEISLLRAHINHFFAPYLTCHNIDVNYGATNGNLTLNHARITSHVILNDLNVCGMFYGENMRCDAIRCADSTFSDLVTLSNTVLISEASFQNCSFHEMVDCTYIEAASFRMIGNESPGDSIHLNLLRLAGGTFKSLFLRCCFIGYPLSLDISAITAAHVSLEGSTVLHGLHGQVCKISHDLNLTSSFFGPSNDAMPLSITLSRSQIGTVYANQRFATIGMIAISGLVIDRSFYIGNAVLLTIPGQCPDAIVGNNLQVTNRILFYNADLEPGSSKIDSEWLLRQTLLVSYSCAFHCYYNSLTDRSAKTRLFQAFIRAVKTGPTEFDKEPLRGIGHQEAIKLLIGRYFKDSQAVLQIIEVIFNRIPMLREQLPDIREKQFKYRATLDTLERMAVVEGSPNCAKIHAGITKIHGRVHLEWAKISGQLDLSGLIIYHQEIGHSETPSIQRRQWIAATMDRWKLLKLMLLVTIGSLELLIDILKLIPMLLLHLVAEFCTDKPINMIIKANIKLKYFSFATLIDPPLEEWQSIVNLANSKIDGELYINAGPKGDVPFRAVGLINLLSTYAYNFYVKPAFGAEQDTRWNIVGMKYESIFTDEEDAGPRLVHCRWFFTNLNDQHYRQPYEQLATTYSKMGDDANARKILMSMPGKKVWEKVMMTTLNLFLRLAIPPHRAMLTLILLWLIGMITFSSFKEHGLLIKLNDSAKVEFSASSYSAQLFVPIINTQQKENYGLTYKSKKFQIHYRGKFCPDFIPTEIPYSWAGLYQNCHSFFGTILLSLFLIGIGKTIRSNNN